MGAVMESIPKTRTDAVIAALVYTISTLIILIIARYLLGTGIGLKEFLVIGGILLVFNLVFQFYLSRRV
jgi:drug/metabolite transporter (DMT)-like permease